MKDEEGFRLSRRARVDVLRRNVGSEVGEEGSSKSGVGCKKVPQEMKGRGSGNIFLTKTKNFNNNKN